MAPLVTAFVVAGFGVTAFILITLAVTCGIPRIVWQVALGLLAVVVVFEVVARQSFKDREEKREVVVTPEYAASVRADGFPITVQRAFEASSFDWFHGDGASLIAYRYSPAESEALITALKQQKPAFVWHDVTPKNYDFASLRELLPPDFLPDKRAWSLLVGRPADGSAAEEFVVDRSRGILYCIKNVF